MIYLGEKKVGTMYLGDKKLSKIYLGDKLVWEGCPEGYVVGELVYAGDTTYVKIPVKYNSTGAITDISVFLKSPSKSTKFKANFIYDDYKILCSNPSIFYSNRAIKKISDCNLTLYENPSSRGFNYFIENCGNLIYVNLNSCKIVPSETAMDFKSCFRSCGNLEKIIANRFDWSKVSRLVSCFYDLPQLKELDLSGTNFNSVIILYSFKNIGSVGTVVKVIGCSATTQNKILNALNTNNSGQTWVLNDGVITRTA